MSESKPPRHPLFDTASTYIRMRKSVRPEYKMRGYFHWQKARAIRLGIPLPEYKPEREEQRLRDLAQRLGGVWGGAPRATMTASVRALAVRSDGPLASTCTDDTPPVWDPDIRVTDAVDVRLFCILRESWFGERALGSLVLVREADGTPTVGLWVMLDEMESRQPVCCRAFLIEPEVLARLQNVVQEACTVDPEKALLHAFAAETVASHRDVARLLSAIPDLDGEVHDGAIHFHRLPIANEFDTFPPRQGPLTVVVVFDDSAAIASAD